MHYFYSPDISQPFVTLSNEESEHCVRVMRHREGDTVRVTDGCGHLADAVIAEAHPKKCLLQILQHPQRITSRHRAHQKRRPHGVAAGKGHRNRHLFAHLPAVRPLRAHTPQPRTSATVGHCRAETVANHVAAATQDDEIHGFYPTKP